MKRMLPLYITTLLFGVCSEVNARIFNSTTSTGGSRIVNAGTQDDQVSPTSSFQHILFDGQTKTMILADNTTETLIGGLLTNNQGIKSLMKADLSGDGVVLSALGGAKAADGSTPLQNREIDKIMWLDNGDLLLLLGDRTKFYIVQNPLGTKQAVIVSSTMVAMGLANPPASIIDVVSAGTTADGKTMRIVVAVVPSSAITTNSASPLSTTDADKGTLYTFLYDGTQITGGSTPGTGIGQSKIVSGSTVSLGTGATGLAGILGATAHIGNISKMVWSPVINRLFIGTSYGTDTGGTASGTTALNSSFIAVGRFASDDSTCSVLGANDIVLETFSPQATTSRANVSSMKTTYWAVNNIDFLINDAANTNYIILQIDYATQNNDIVYGSVYALPVVGLNPNILSDLGKLASADGASVALSTFAPTDYGFIPQQTPTAACSDVKSLVGGYNAVSTGFSDMEIEIYKDIVYLVARGSTQRPDVGVFASHPLFDANGNAAGWSSWKKAFADSYYNQSTPQGSTINGVRFDDNDGTLYYTAMNYDSSTVTIPATINEVGMLNWGLGDPQNVSGIYPFLTRINSDFNNTGVWTVADFPAIQTVGLGNCGLTIVALRDKVAIASTGGLLTRYIGSAATDTRIMNPMDRPYNISEFSNSEINSNPQYILYDNVDGIGDILCAEVARVTNADPRSSITTDPTPNGFPYTHGFIFVGGRNGIAVLRNSDGTGFDSNCGKKTQAASGDYMSDALQTLNSTLSEMTFKRIPGINEPIHAMVSSMGFLYAMGAKTVYRIRLHSYLTELFPTDSDATSEASMFQDVMNVQTVPATEDLSNLAGSYPGEYVSDNIFYSKVVVIQTVLTAGSDEYFSCMTGFPNSGSIFVASNQAGSSNIYAIKVPGAYSCNPAATYRTITSTVFGDEYYVKSFPYMIRCLALEPINVLNGNLETYSGTTTLTHNFINGITQTTPVGLYGISENSGLIGNLYVVSGSVYTPSSLYVHAVNGNVKGLVYNGSEDQLRSPLISLASDSTWLSDPIQGGLTCKLSMLPSGLDLTGPTYIYSHANNGISNYLMRLSFPDVPMLKNIDAGIIPSSYVFSSTRFANGAQCLFGVPFGGRGLD